MSCAKTDKILGCHIIGAAAGELIHEVRGLQAAVPCMPQWALAPWVSDSKTAGCGAPQPSSGGRQADLHPSRRDE